MKIPTLSHSSDTVIYMFYGDSAITSDQSNKTATWDSSYVAVYHLPNGSSLSAADSTSHANNGTNTSSPNASSGKIGGAGDFSPSSSYISTPNSASLQITGSYTLSAWIKGSGAGDIVGKYGSSVGYWMNSAGASGLEGGAYNSSVEGGRYGGPNLNDNAWHEVAAVYTSGSSPTVSVFVDGTNYSGTAFGSIPTYINDDGATGAIARDETGNGRYSGLIDEVRISNSARSSDWIATQFNSESSPSTFYSVGSATTSSPSTTIATYYFHPDHLSPRVTTDSSGNVIGQQGHYPFGESWYAASTTTKYQFTSYERDSESGNDYAQARYDVNRLGRFASPDPLDGAPGNPQTWNHYAYVLNSPVNSIDPTGMADCSADTDSTSTPKCAIPMDSGKALTTIGFGVCVQCEMDPQALFDSLVVTELELQLDGTHTKTLDLGGEKVKVTYSEYVDISFTQNGVNVFLRGVTIDAQPSGCTDSCRWIQTLSGPGAPSNKSPVDCQGNQCPLYPGGQYPGEFYDHPGKSGEPPQPQENFTTTLGIVQGQSFNTIGTIQWGYSIGTTSTTYSGFRINGLPIFQSPVIATPAQQAQSLNMVRSQYTNWTISGAH